MITVVEVRTRGVMVESDTPISVRSGDSYQIYRVVNSQDQIVGTAHVTSVFGPKFKLQPDDGVELAALVGDLVRPSP